MSELNTHGYSSFAEYKCKVTPLKATSQEWKEYTAELEQHNKLLTLAHRDLDKLSDDQAIKLARYSMTAGEADQYKNESLACRKSLGFSASSENVAPIDLVNAIRSIEQQNKKLKQDLKDTESCVIRREAVINDYEQHNLELQANNARLRERLIESNETITIIASSSKFENEYGHARNT